MENAMKHELCTFSNPPLFPEKGFRNLKGQEKTVGVMMHHPTEFTEEMHCIQISVIEWLGRDLKDHLIPILPCHRQRHLPVNQTAQTLIQRELKWKTRLTWILLKLFYVFSIIFWLSIILQLVHYHQPLARQLLGYDLQSTTHNSICCIYQRITYI